MSTAGATAVAPTWDARTSRAAFETIYRDHYVFVWRCLRRLGVAEAATEDALQEVFVVAYRRLHTFEHRASLRAWLGGIARRVAFRHRRSRERRDRRHDALSRVPPPSADLDDWLRRREAEVFLEAFLENLDADKREVFVLCDLEGMRGREAAAALGVNQNTAYSRLRAARALFERACAQARSDGFDMDGPRVQQVHAAEQPERRAAQRSWLAIAGKLGSGGALGAGGSGAAATSVAKTTLGTASLGLKAKAIAVTVVLGGTGVVAATSVDRQLDDQGGSQPLALVREANVEGEIDTGRTSVPEPTVDAAPGHVYEPLAAVLADPPIQRPSARPAPGAHDPAPEEALRRELERMEMMQAAADRGNWQAVLAVADDYARSHPEGQLTHEATGLVVEAHCRLGAPLRAKSLALTRLGRAEGARLFASKCSTARALEPAP